jgi:hypothetical protein
VVAVIAVVIVAIIAVSVLAYEYEPGQALNPYKVHVTEVIWTQSGSALSSEAGFTVKAGQIAHVTVTLSCSPGFFGTSQTCSSGSVYVETHGFGLAASNAPFTWSSGSTGSTMTVNAAVTTPTSSFTGNLTIDLH